MTHATVRMNPDIAALRGKGHAMCEPIQETRPEKANPRRPQRVKGCQVRRRYGLGSERLYPSIFPAPFELHVEIRNLRLVGDDLQRQGLWEVLRL